MQENNANKEQTKRVKLREQNVDEMKSISDIQKNLRIVYDMSVKPEGMSMQQLAQLTDAGYIIYDSKLNPDAQIPQLFSVSTDEIRQLPKLVDLKGEEMNIAELTKEFEVEEYWRKELYTCRRSPVKFFTEYLSGKSKPTQEEINAYKDSIGLVADISKENVTKVMDAYAKTITVDKLQELRPVRDLIDQEYEAETIELLIKAGTKLKFKPSKPKEGKKKIMNDIMNRKTSIANGDLQAYVTPAHRWDKKMFEITDLDVLVRLWCNL